MRYAYVLLVATVLFLAGCLEGGAKMKLTSPAFENNGVIPVKYSCDGLDISPPLTLSDIPNGTESIAHIVDDPDAPMGTWDHWIFWDADPVETINEDSTPYGAVLGMNSFKRLSYGGPCPPDREHRYFFRAYALDIKLQLPEGSSKGALLKAMENHILAESELMGRYDRKH